MTDDAEKDAKVKDKPSLFGFWKKAGKPSLPAVPHANKALTRASGSSAFNLQSYAPPSLPRINDIQKNKQIVLLVDATYSRFETWTRAQGALKTMLAGIGKKNGGIQIKLGYFGGGKLTFDSFRAPADVAKRMGDVHCIDGKTQFCGGLKTALEDAKAGLISSVIMIGDAFEEEPGVAVETARALGRHKVPVFIFHEGDDAYAAGVFERIARHSGGALRQYGHNNDLSQLFEAVDAFVHDGMDGLKRLSATNETAGSFMKQLTHAKLLGPSHDR